LAAPAKNLVPEIEMALRTAGRLSRRFPNGIVEREELEGDALEALVRADRAWNDLPRSKRQRYGSDRFVFLRMYVRRRLLDALRSREGKHLKKLATRADGTPWEEEIAGSGLTLAEVVADPTQDTEAQAMARVRMGAERPPRPWARRRKKRDLAARHGGLRLAPGELETLADAAVGLTAQESGRLRHRSVETVKSQRRSCIAKLVARNTTHAVHLAHVHGLLTARQTAGPGYSSRPKIELSST
jgi:DNA-binding CsgD family transcriptional regulator